MIYLWGSLHTVKSCPQRLISLTTGTFYFLQIVMFLIFAIHCGCAFYWSISFLYGYFQSGKLTHKA